MSPSSLRNLKRGQNSVADIGPPSKRTRSSTGTTELHRARDVSPSKNVHFPRNLILGPHEADPRRRSLSPSRSALRRQDSAIGGIDSPSMQLLKEQAATPAVSSSRKKQTSPKRKQVATKTSSVENAGENASDTDIELEAGAGDNIVSTSSGEEICDLVNKLKERIEHFAESFLKPVKSDVLSPLLKTDNRQLIRYIGLLALGGKGGRDGWQALLSEGICRHGLISGIVGRALKENVFDELCFGANAELVEKLKEQEREQYRQDGFFRTRKRAALILKHEKKCLTTATLNKAVAQVALQLERLLLPLWMQGGTTTSWRKADKRGELVAIVSEAANISHAMRKDFDSVYYWPPTFKDEEFEPERMECFNMDDMISKSPYEMKASNTGSIRPILREGHKHEDTAIVRIVCFPGLVSYQQGGGESAQRELTSKKKARSAMGGGQNGLSSDKGFRTRILCTSAHSKAMESGGEKYKKDNEGFVDLYDLFLEATAKYESSAPAESPMPPHQSWIPSVSRLFSRSPSVQLAQS